MSRPHTESDWETAASVNDEIFNARDANIVLRSTVTVEEDPDPNNQEMQATTTYLFRVHRNKLAAASTFFRDMFEAVEYKNTEATEDVPVLDVQEEPAVVRTLLGAAYNDLALFASLGSSEWRAIFEVYQAANKYGLYVLRSYTQALLMLRITAGDIKGQDALVIYIRASMFDDAALAERILPEASELDLESLSVQNLGDLPPRALHKLIQARSGKRPSREAQLIGMVTRTIKIVELCQLRRCGHVRAPSSYGIPSEPQTQCFAHIVVELEAIGKQSS